MALSENIKTRRKALKMSQEYVAEQLDISRQAVAKWEAGKSEPTTENLVKLAALFEMSVSELVEPENIAEAEAARQEQERERQHNARMLSGRFFAYIFVDAGAMGYFRLYPNDSPGWWWTLIFVCGAVGLFITSRDMHKRHKNDKGSDRCWHRIPRGRALFAAFAAVQRGLELARCQFGCSSLYYLSQPQILAVYLACQKSIRKRLE